MPAGRLVTDSHPEYQSPAKGYSGTEQCRHVTKWGWEAATLKSRVPGKWAAGQHSCSFKTAFLKLTLELFLRFRLDNLRIFSFKMIKVREALSFHFKAKPDFIRQWGLLFMIPDLSLCYHRALPSRSSIHCQQNFTEILEKVKKTLLFQPMHATHTHTSGYIQLQWSEISGRKCCMRLWVTGSYGTSYAPECACFLSFWAQLISMN